MESTKEQYLDPDDFLLSWLAVRDLMIDDTKVKSFAEESSFDIQQINRNIPSNPPPQNEKDFFFLNKIEADDVYSMFIALIYV